LIFIIVITIKLPYSTSIDCQDLIGKLRQQQSCVIRFGYKKLENGLKDTPIRHLIKQKLNNIDLIDSWLVDSCIMESKTIFSTKKPNTIFGGKKNWKDYICKKISKEEYKKKRLFKFTCYGGKNHFGNRKFKLDFDNNKIIFKYKCKQHFDLDIKLPVGNYKKQLFRLQQECERRNHTYSIKLDNEYVTSHLNHSS
jgi:hypothetical protein